MAALRIRAGTDVPTAMPNSNNGEALKSACSDGFSPVGNPHAAMPQKISAAVAASRRLPRNVAHSNGIRIRKPNRLR